MALSNTDNPQVESRIHIESVSFERTHEYSATRGTADDRVPVNPSQIWLNYDDIPSLPNPDLVANGGPITGAPVELISMLLSPVAGSMLKFEQDTDGPAPAGSFNNVIPSSFGDNAKLGGLYKYSLRNNSGTTIPYDGATWVVDGENHYVEFPQGAPTGGPFTLDFYRYTGAVGGAVGGAGLWQYLTDENDTVTICPDPVANGYNVSANFSTSSQGCGGVGSRLMFDDEKGALRAGVASGTEWDDPNRGEYSTAFGFNNTASADKSVIGGGGENEATGISSSICGGGGNKALSEYAHVGGGHTNTAGLDDLVGPMSVVGGGEGNTATGSYSVIGGGYSNIASAKFSTVCCGELNKALSKYAHVCGGHTNTAGIDETTGLSSVVSGGSNNNAAADYSTVCGGDTNVATGIRSTICGGNNNTVSAQCSAIGGGSFNKVFAIYTTISGGVSNTVDRNCSYSTIGGGEENLIGQECHYATIGGGSGNNANGNQSTISGGNDNTVGGAGMYATVCGGFKNEANGEHSLVAGGFANVADGNSSFAAGKQSYAKHDHSFVWGDGSAIISSFANKTFTALTSGGTRFYSDAKKLSGVELSANSNSWSAVSDINKKENLIVLDPVAVLHKLDDIPIYQYNYIGTPAGMVNRGPVAQDWHAAFPSPEKDPLRIDTMDPIGVALAAIKGLSQLVRDQYEQLRLQSDRIAVLESHHAK